jgi:hypothetical protein
MAFGTSIKLGNIKENWLFKLANRQGGFLYFSFADVLYSSNYYRGVILNSPTIRESIDLAKSTAKTSNISITIPDYDYNGAPISKELFGGTNNYINQAVTIHSQINADTPTQIGSFRLIDIQSNGINVQLSLTQHRPWDFVKFPQDQTTISKKYFPTVYGEFVENTSSPSSQNLCDGRKLYPTPVDNTSGKILALAIREYDGGAAEDGRLHHYEKDSDQFVPIDDSGFTDVTDTAAYQGGKSIRCKVDLNRGFKTKPRTSLATTEFTNTDNSFDLRTDDSSTYASNSFQLSTATVGQTDTETKTLNVSAPNIVGKITELIVFVRYRWEHTTRNETDGNLKLSFGGTLYNITSTSSGSDQTYTSTDLVSKYTSNNNQIPDVIIQSIGNTEHTGAASDDVFTTRIYDIQLHVKVALDFANDSESSKNYLDGLEHMYIGANGLTESYSGSGAEITLIHEAHRDMLIRYASMTTSTPTGWSDLETSKDNWKIRYWQLEPVDLQKELERLQYEGGFIFRYNNNSPEYIHIKDSYSSTAESNILSKSDIKNINVKVTPFSELLTKQTISYEKHPAEDRYLTTTEATNSTARTNWNIQTKENTSQVSLKAYVSPAIPTTPASNPNDDFYTYYDNIFGTVKLMVDCTIVNPKFYALGVGDVIEFDENNMFPATPMGHNSATWNGLKMMIVSMSRSVGTLKITAREI